jgi:hypothetical protein
MAMVTTLPTDTSGDFTPNVLPSQTALLTLQSPVCGPPVASFTPPTREALSFIQEDTVVAPHPKARLVMLGSL